VKNKVKNYLRKKRHLRYVNKYLASIRWEIINTVIAASATEHTPAVTKHLENLGGLIRKYERRRRWLKF
jgi:ribosomal 50S subunit-associated protein YjgA (DUF615 family)